MSGVRQVDMEAVGGLIAKRSSDPTFKHRMMLLACETDNVVAAKLVAEALGVSAEDVRLNGNIVLRTACRNGCLKVLEWLVDSFGLTVQDLRAGDDIALYVTCREGQIHVLKWLFREFSFSPHDVKRYLGKWSLLAVACAFGHLRVAKWLDASFGLPPLSEADIGVILRDGGLKTIKWAFARSSIDKYHLRNFDHLLLQIAFENESTEVLEWVFEQFDLNVDDIRAVINVAYVSDAQMAIIAKHFHL